MKKRDPKPTPLVKPTQAPLDENPLAKPEVSKKDLVVKKKKLKSLKRDNWKV